MELAGSKMTPKYTIAYIDSDDINKISSPKYLFAIIMANETYTGSLGHLDNAKYTILKEWKQYDGDL